MVLNFVVPTFVIIAEIRHSYPIKYFTVTITIHYICSRDELKNSYWCSNDEISVLEFVGKIFKKPVKDLIFNNLKLNNSK